MVQCLHLIKGPYKLSRGLRGHCIAAKLALHFFVRGAAAVILIQLYGPKLSFARKHYFHAEFSKAAIRFFILTIEVNGSYVDLLPFWSLIIVQRTT